MLSKEITNTLQECVEKELFGVVTLDRCEVLTLEHIQSNGIWMFSDRLYGKHKGVIPAKELRKLMWKEEDNRWFKEGRGVAYASRHPDTGMTAAGLAILVPKEKGARMRSLTDSDVYIDEEGAD